MENVTEIAMDVKLINVVRKLKQYDNEGQNWLNSLPSDINMVFFENGYVDSVCNARQELFAALFGIYADDVNWFLYEYDPVRLNKIWTYENKGTPEEKETEWVIDSEESYYNYLEKACP